MMIRKLLIALLCLALGARTFVMLTDWAVNKTPVLPKPKWEEFLPVIGLGDDTETVEPPFPESKPDFDNLRERAERLSKGMAND